MAKLPSFLVENVCQINIKLITFQQNLPTKFLRNRLFFTNPFSANFALKMSAKFPQNQPFFSENLFLKIPRNWTFSMTYQKS